MSKGCDRGRHLVLRLNRGPSSQTRPLRLVPTDRDRRLAASLTDGGHGLETGVATCLPAVKWQTADLYFYSERGDLVEVAQGFRELRRRVQRQVGRLGCRGETTVSVREMPSN